MGDVVSFDGLPEDEYAPQEAACPHCGERRVGALTINYDESMDCATCSRRYYLPGSLKRLIADIVEEVLRQQRA